MRKISIFTAFTILASCSSMSFACDTVKEESQELSFKPLLKKDDIETKNMPNELHRRDMQRMMEHNN